MAMTMLMIMLVVMDIVVMVVVSMAMLMSVIPVTMLMIMVFMAMLMSVNMFVQLGSSMAGLMAVLVVVIPMTVLVLMIVVSVTVLMSMLVVMDIVAFFFLSIYSHGHVGSCDPAFNCGLCLNTDIFKTQLIHFFQESLFVRAYFIKSCHEHISCCSHTAIKIDRLHIFPPFSGLSPEMIDHTGQISGPKSIINIDHADPAGAGIQHG